MTGKTKIGILIGTNIIVTAGLITALAIAPTRNNSNHSNSGTTTSETRKIEVKAKASVDLSKKIDQLSNPSTEWFDFNGKSSQEKVTNLIGKYDSKTQILTLEFDLLDTKTLKSQHFLLHKLKLKILEAEEQQQLTMFMIKAIIITLL